ncbi:MAG: phosphatase PAP2 family protein [Pseudomonadota bacterium]
MFTVYARTMKRAINSASARWLGEVPVYAIALALMMLCISLLLSKGVSPGVSGIWISFKLFFGFAFFIGTLDAGWQLVTQRPDSIVQHMIARYFSITFFQRFLTGLPFLVVATALLPYFSKMKSAIPLFNEYSWDETFIQWDQAIFFGYDAWEVIQPVLGFPIVTAFLAFLYHLWFLLLYPGILYFSYAHIDNQLRRQFFLSYVLSWCLIGGAMATWLASVGPCFVGPLLGDPRFDAQMAYLNAANEQVPIMTLKVQGMLLDWFDADADGLGSGITAMPSMHVAVAFLYWLAMRRISPRLGLFFGVFFAITWISSVHLAYHYAVDGLVSVLAVLVLWWASQRIITAWDAFIATRAQAALRTNTVPAE